MHSFWKSLLLLTPFYLQAAIINDPVCNIFSAPTEDTEVNTQVIYGTSVEFIEEKDEDWCKIRTEFGELGWIRKDSLINNSAFEKNSQLRPVKNLFAHVYKVDDTSPFPPLLTLPYGSQVKLIDTADKGERWVLIELADGKKAWIQRGDIDFHPNLKTIDEVISWSKMFMGLPYTWGGASSYGFDCSGFIQTLLKQIGLTVPHSARKQAESSFFTTVERSELKRGDLIFFGEGKITHVGLYLGNDNFLHAGVRDEAPLVRISNLQTTKYNFYAARRIKQEFLPK